MSLGRIAREVLEDLQKRVKDLETHTHLVNTFGGITAETSAPTYNPDPDAVDTFSATLDKADEEESLFIKTLKNKLTESEGNCATLASMLAEVIKFPPTEMRRAGIKSYLYQIGQREAADAIKAIP